MNAITEEVNVFLRIGKTFLDLKGFFGRYDNVCVWSRALSEEELLATQGSTVCSSDETGLVLNFNFDNDRDEAIQPAIFDEVSGTYLGNSNGILSDSKTVMDYGAKNTMHHAPSHGSSRDGGLQVIVCEGIDIACELDLSCLEMDGETKCESFNIVSIPIVGKIFIDSVEVTTTDLPSFVNASVVVTYSSSVNIDDESSAFQYTANFLQPTPSTSSSNSKVVIRYNSAPTLSGIKPEAGVIIGSASVIIAQSFGDTDVDGDEMMTQIKVIAGTCNDMLFLH